MKMLIERITDNRCKKTMKNLRSYMPTLLK